jgi:RNA polymerase sigma factor (sigma-70 family)
MMEPESVLGSHRDVKEATKPADVFGSAESGGETFADFYRREYDRSVRLAWLLTGSRTAAEDVVQDAMTGVYRSFARVESPAAYLRRAVVNRAKSRQRDEQRQQDRLVFQEPVGRAADDADGELLALIGQLPYRQRVVIVARYWGGWPEKEIARALGCRPGTVKSLAARALNRLRTEVQP